MDSVAFGRKWLPPILMFTATACWADPAAAAGGENRELINVNARFAEMGFVDRTYSDSIPRKMQTAFTRNTDKSKAGGVDLIIDSAGGKEIFPIARHAREFDNEKELAEFMRKMFLIDSENGDKNSGTYLRVGDSYMYDPDPGIAYSVDDPILAYVGGAKGVVQVGGKPYCIDPDGKCDSELASYLVPVGQPTAPTDRDVCGTVIAGTPVCVHHHTFFNRTWFFGTYVRHGTNVRFTTWAALPSSEIRLGFDLSGPSTSLVIVVGIDPVIGEDSAEAAIFCWGNCLTDVANAEQICSRNTVIDPDLTNLPIRTANGPANDPTSSFCTIFL